MEPPRFFETFNQPKPKIPAGKRDFTNTPAQSLALLNEPLVSEQAEYWARRLVRGRETTVAARLETMFQTAFGRRPGAGEIARWQDAAADFAALHGMPADPAILGNLAVWKDIAHAMYNAKEFIFIR